MNEVEIAERLTKVEESTKSAHHRIDNFEELTKTISDMVIEVKYLRLDLNKVQKEIDESKQKETEELKKGKDNHKDFWVKVLIGVTTAVCTAIGTYLLTNVF